MIISTQYPRQTGEKITEKLTFERPQEIRVALAAVERWGQRVARGLNIRSYFSEDRVASENAWIDCWHGGLAQDLRVSLAKLARGYDLSSIVYLDPDVELIRGSVEAMAANNWCTEEASEEHWRDMAQIAIAGLTELDNMEQAVEIPVPRAELDVYVKGE